MVIKLYSVFVGLLLALFVGVGVSAFYPAPKAPDYPSALERQSIDAETPAIQKDRLAYEQASRDHQLKTNEYNRNVSLLTLAAAVVLLAIGLTVFRATALMADGLTLGAVFTLSYSIVRGFGTDDSTFRFLMVAAGLAVALTLGYFKFVKPTLKPTKKRR